MTHEQHPNWVRLRDWAEAAGFLPEAVASWDAVAIELRLESIAIEIWIERRALPPACDKDSLALDVWIPGMFNDRQNMSLSVGVLPGRLFRWQGDRWYTWSEWLMRPHDGTKQCR